MPGTRPLHVAWVMLLGVAVAAVDTCTEDECNGHGRCAHEACVCFPGWAGLGCDVCEIGTTYDEDSTECVGNPFLSSFCSLSLARALYPHFLSLSQAHSLSNAHSLWSSSARALCLSLSLSLSLLLSLLLLLVFSLSSCGVTNIFLWYMYRDTRLNV